MKTGEAAKLMGVDGATIRNWIDNEELNRFFSEAAQGEHGGPHRLLSEEDVLLLNTIRTLRTRGITEWHDIAEKLDSGVREQEFPANAISFDNRLIPIPQAKQAAELLQMQAERDAALQAKVDLEKEIERLRAENKELNESRMKEIAQREREIGKLQAQIEMLREMMDGRRSE